MISLVLLVLCCENQKNYLICLGHSNQAVLSDQQKILVEKLGVLNERGGLQPVASRVLALMLVADRTEITFDEIREILSISKSAASNAINLLLNTDKITYITKPGDRRRYFKSSIKSWKNNVQARLAGLEYMSSLFNEVLAQRPAETAEFNKSMKEVIDFLDFMAERIPALYQEFEAQHDSDRK